MADVTKDQLEDLKSLALSLAPAAHKETLEADAKAREHYPLDLQANFFNAVIGKFEETDVSKYASAPAVNNGGGVRKADRSNPWSAAGWNVSEQGKLAKRLGEDKAASMAKSAGCVLGSTKPNPLFN